MIKKLLKCIREFKKEFILAPVCVALEAVISVVIPFLMAVLIDRGVNEQNMAEVYRIGALLIICTIISFILGITSGKLSAKACTGFSKNLRHDIYYKVQEFSFFNIDKFSTSSIITRLTTDVTNVQNSLQMLIRIAIKAPLTLLFALIMSFAINIKLSFIFLGIIPFLGIGFYLIIIKAHPIFEKVFKTYDKLNNIVQENVRGIRVVKSYVTENHEVKKFEKISDTIYKDFSKAQRILAFNGPIMQFSMYLAILLISWLGAKAIVSTTMTTGELTSLIAYAMQILMSLMMLSIAFVMIIISKTSTERIVEILDEQSDLKNCKNPIYKVENGSITFENVEFSYVKNKEKLCLKNINLEIKAGETIGIIGGTGSSKTTLVQLIPRLYDTTLGSVKVGGINVKDYDIQTLRNEVAVVLQKNVLFSGTIKENLRWGNEKATDEELINACKIAQADEFIEKFEKKYDTYIEQDGTNVSGGQKQRICIARAILKQPKILILDDSTSAVDTKTDNLIRKEFKNAIPNTTKIIIAQRISSIEDADRIIVLDNGCINAIGTHQELLETNSIYNEVYTSQTKGSVINAK